MVCKKETSAGWLILSKNNEILLLKKRYGQWDFPKGHVESGETLEVAANRELEEETGIPPSNIERIPGFDTKLQYAFVRGNKKICKTVHVFLAKLKEDVPVKISKEHRGYKWMPLNETLTKMTYADQRDLMKKAKDFLNTSNNQYMMEDICIKCGKRKAEVGLLCSKCFVPKVKMPKPFYITKCRECGKLLVAGKWQHMSNEKLANYLAKKIKGDFTKATVDIENKEASIIYTTDDGNDVVYKYPYPIKFEKGICPNCSKMHGSYYEAILQLRGNKSKAEKLKRRFIKYAADSTFIGKEEEKHGGIDLYIGYSKVLMSFLAEEGIKDYKLSRKLHTQKEGKRLYRITVAIRFD